MLYRVMLATITATMVIYLTFNATLISATDELKAEDTVIIKEQKSEDVEKITEAQNNTITKLLEYINKEIRSIDEKIILTRGIIEYEKYPAVRLNIDTPYFGIESIINSKLKIKEGASTVDIATGYNIRNVVNKKVIKIPTFEVSNIIVITRDVKLDKNMTYNDAQISIFKLLDYLLQVKEVNKFVDRQLTTMIKGYYSKEKLDIIYNIEKEVEEINENLNFSLIELSFVNALTEYDISETLSNLNKYRLEIAGVKRLIKNVHTNEEKLNEVLNKVHEMNSSVKLFRFDINKEYLKVNNNLDLDQACSLIIQAMEEEIQFLEKYVLESKIEEEILDVEEEIKNDTLNIVKHKNEEEKYIVASEPIIQNMKKDLIKIEEIIEKIAEYKLENEKYEELKKEEPDLKPSKILEDFNSKEISFELIKIYIGFLNKETVFLTENAKANITNTKKLQDINIKNFEDIEYIYISLLDILVDVSDDFVSGSIISNKQTIQKLKKVINKTILIKESFKPEEQN